MAPKAHQKKEKQIKVLSPKGTIKKLKDNADMEKISVNHLADRELISRIYKELLKPEEGKEGGREEERERGSKQPIYLLIYLFFK